MLVLISIRQSQALQLRKHISSEVKNICFKVITASGEISTIKITCSLTLVFPEYFLSSCAFTLGRLTKSLAQIFDP